MCWPLNVAVSPVSTPDKLLREGNGVVVEAYWAGEGGKSLLDIAGSLIKPLTRL